MKKLVIKAVITVIILLIVNTVISAFEPVVSSQVAVNQLNDSYDSNATMTIYQHIKDWTWLGNVIVLLLVFFKDIKKQFVGGKNNETRN